jgi:hypothetical protein
MESTWVHFYKTCYLTQRDGILPTPYQKGTRHVSLCCLDHPEAHGSDHVPGLCPLRAEHSQRRALLLYLCGVGSDAAAETTLLCPLCPHAQHGMVEALGLCGAGMDAVGSIRGIREGRRSSPC